MKKIIVFILLASALLNMVVYANDLERIDAKSYVLMDGISGKILIEKNATEKLPPASITKIMTMLLVMEEIDAGNISYDDVVTVSETAAKQEGSHVFLASGEKITVRDLLKAVAVASGNDAARALAEYVSGTQAAFVVKMNEIAKN